MTKLQFRVLYREFLFRMVDLELLSAHALGDSNRLLGQFASMLLFLSIMLTGPALGYGQGSQEDRVFYPLSTEHFLISTTMLIVGLFAVLSWDSMYPNKRDVLVLAPLPVQQRTFFWAKVAAVSSALGVTVVTLHALPGLVWPLVLGSPTPALTAPALTWDAALPPAEASDLKAILDRDLRPALTIGALAPGTDAGMVIGVSKFGKRSVAAYGIAKPDSIFEIGSVSKTFTALLLAQMVADGKAKLEQPVRELLPAGTVAKPHGDEITLLDLATHHSGLSTMPDNMNFDSQPNPDADYHPADLYAYIKRRGIRKLRNTPFLYSNLGFGLLGTALADHEGTTYADLLRQRITGPLAMNDTALSLLPQQQERLIQAYGSHHNPMPAWDLDALAPAGAIRSTADDMLSYLEANLRTEKLPADFAVAVKNSQVPRMDIAGGMQIALAWILDTDSGTYWHNGAISGYTSYAFFRPDRDYAGVVLFNHPPNGLPFVDLVGQHIRRRLAGEPALSLASITLPASGGILMRLRWFGVYWITVTAAAVFMFCFVLGLQGMAAQLLPRRCFLRASSFLQLAAFALIVGVYFTQPILSGPDALEAAQGRGLLAWSPSYWFLGMMQQLHGSPILPMPARRAWIGLVAALLVTAAAYALSYFRTLRKIVEEPDILPGVRGLHWLPRFGEAPRTAIVQFSIRTLLRSRQHRVILAFYLGIGFAMTIFLLRSPALTERILETASADPWHSVSIPILASTLIMMFACVVGMRVLFSMPLDLGANWIFRITARLDGRLYAAAARRSLLALSVAPVWCGAAILCLSTWPWQPALAHLATLALFGALLADVCLYTFRKIPFTCSYLPGKSQVHVVILVSLLLLYFTLFAVKYEREVLADPASVVKMLAAIAALLVCARWRSAAQAKSEPYWLRFEDAHADEIMVLGLTAPGPSVLPNQTGRI